MIGNRLRVTTAVASVLVACAALTGCGASTTTTTAASTRSNDVEKSQATPSITTPTAAIPSNTSTSTSAYTSELQESFVNSCVGVAGQGGEEASATATCNCVWRGIASTIPFAEYEAEKGTPAGQAYEQQQTTIVSACKAASSAY